MSSAKRLPSRSWMRPTTSKTRESLMATLREELVQARVLDLFAGSGSLGLAALEAGASQVVFVESDPRSLKFLKEAIAEVVGEQEELGEKIHLVAGRLPGALARLSGTFDIVLADPPYISPEGPVTLAALTSLLKTESVVIFEHHHKEAYPEIVGNLHLYKRRRFGETALSFWRNQPFDGPSEE